VTEHTSVKFTRNSPADLVPESNFSSFLINLVLKKFARFYFFKVGGGGGGYFNRITRVKTLVLFATVRFIFKNEKLKKLKFHYFHILAHTLNQATESTKTGNELLVLNLNPKSKKLTRIFPPKFE
jgi:hypothetical protein